MIRLCQVSFSLLCGLFVLQLSVAPVRAEVVQPRSNERGFVIVTSESAEIREGPSPKYKVIESAKRGEVFPKAGRTGRWYYVEIDEDTFGWMSGRDLERYANSQSPTDERSPYPGRYYFDLYYPWQPFLFWDYYFYDRGPRWEGKPGWQGRFERPSRDWDRDRGGDRDRDGGGGPGFRPQPRESGPRGFSPRDQGSSPKR